MQGRSVNITIIVLLVAVLFVAAYGAFQRSDAVRASDAQQWEYLRADVANLEGCEFVLNGVQQMSDPNKTRYDCVNDLGAQGWELVTVSNLSYYFKRPR